MVAVLVGVGCGPEPVDGEPNTGSGTSGSVPQTSSSSSSSANPSTESSSTDAPACEGDFEHDPSGPDVEVNVTNASEEVVYLELQFACVSSYLRLEDATGESLEWRTDGWLPSCEELAGGSPICGGPGCIASAIRLEPGAVYAETWPGYVFELQTLGDACLVGVSEDCGNTCYIRRNPPGGTYRLSLRYASEADCGEQDCAELCENDVGPGACELFYFDDILGDLATLEAPFTHPSTSTIELMIE